MLEEMGVFSRLLGWCREPKMRLRKLRLLDEASRAEGVVLPLLFEIGILLWLPFPFSLFLRYPIWILSFEDFMGISYIGLL